MQIRLPVLLISAILLIQCSQPATVDTDNEAPTVQFTKKEDGVKAPEKLSDFGLFEEPISALNPKEGLMPYSLKMPLFSDYAEKSRFVHIPEGSKAEFDAFGKVLFPVGTSIFKTFWYPESNSGKDLIETRVLFHAEDGWRTWPYIWNAEQTEAYYTPAGGTTTAKLAGGKTFEYSIPNENQCKSCHLIDGQITTIGPSYAQLNSTFNYGKQSKNQWDTWLEKEMIAAMPAYDNLPYIPDWANHTDGTLDQRARAYLDINCAHCHSPVGPAKTSGLNLSVHNTDLYSLGLNKPPVAAGKGSGGLLYDIVGGKPEKSILHYRMVSNDPGIMMPELGRKMEHKEGIALIAEWIQKMD